MIRDDVDTFFEHDVHIPSRTIYMGSAAVYDDGEESGVDVAMAERVVKALHMMDQGEGDINIIMNNPGGSLIEGYAIYDAIKERKNFITIKVYGKAMSMGTIILQAADKRILTPNCRFMIHYGYSGLPYDHSETNERWSEYMKKEKRHMEDLYLDVIREKHPRFTKAKLKKLLEFDTIMFPEEAVELGLADEISE